MSIEFSYTPHALRETCQGTQVIDLRDEMLSRRELELVEEVTAESTTSLIRALRHLQLEDASAPITLYVNSPGGEVQSGLALYDAMQATTCPIRTVCLGIAASMAAIIFISGEQRDMLPHSRVMIHDPLIGTGGIGGSALSVKATADNLMRTRSITAEIIAKHTGMTLEQVFELTATDTYFEAQEALDAHLADSIVTSL